MSRSVSFSACFHWVILIFALLLPLFVYLCNLLSSQFLQIIIWISFHFNLLTGYDFHFVLVYHFSLDLKVRIVIWRLWKIILTYVTCGWIFYNDGSILTVLMLTWVLFLLFVVKHLFCNWHFTEIWKLRCVSLNCFRILYFWDRPLFVDKVTGFVYRVSLLIFFDTVL